MFKQEHNQNCELCVITKRVFGDRFKGCADIGNQYAFNALKSMMVEHKSVMHDLEVLKADGKVSDEDYEALKVSIEHSLPFAVGMLPALICTEDGLYINPSIMMTLVQANMTHLMQVMLEEKLEREGLGGLIDVLMNATKRAEQSEEEKEAILPPDPKKKPDPNLN